MNDSSRQHRVIEAPTHLGVDNRTAFFKDASDLIGQIPEGTGTLIIDLGQTRFVDAAGLSTLALVQKKAAEGQRVVSLKNPNEEVRFSIVFAGLDRLFELDPETR